MNPKVTNKLFYGKWIYKVECHIPHARYLRYGWKPFSWYSKMTEADLDNFSLIKEKLAVYTKDEIAYRTENNFLSIYSRDPTILDKILKDFESYVTEVWKPASPEDEKFLIDQGRKKVVCDSFPKEKFQYKIFLKNNIPPDIRKDIYHWLERQTGHNIHVSPTTIKWLDGSIYWTNTPFMYVSDPKVLSIVVLMIDKNIRLIEEYVLRSSINTETG